MKFILQAVFFCGFLGVIGCTHTPNSEPFQTRIYDANYDLVWDMAVKALADYPIKISNKDAGKIHTEVVNNPYNELFLTFPEKIDLPERFRYSLKLSIANITEKDDDTLVRIRVTKELEKFHDFYTGWLPYGSDGIEEKLILYRIQHLIEMEKRFNKQQN